MIEDPSIELMLERRAELEKGAREFDRLDKSIKDAFREIPESVCGPFLIRGKPQTRHYKAKDASTSTVWLTDIMRIAPAPTPSPETEEAI